MEGVCMEAGLHGGGLHGGVDSPTEIWSTSGRYASYWNAFLFKNRVLFGANYYPGLPRWGCQPKGGESNLLFNHLFHKTCVKMIEV